MELIDLRAHNLRDQEAGGSNPLAPTILPCFILLRTWVHLGPTSSLADPHSPRPVAEIPGGCAYSVMLSANSNVRSTP